MEIVLVLIGVLAPVDGTKLEYAVAVGAAAVARQSSRNSGNLLGTRGNVLGAGVGADRLLLGVRSRGGGSQREEGRLVGSREGEELLRRKARHDDG